MKAKQSLQCQLWGIYDTDREFTREVGDPLHTVIKACSKPDAEEEAARLGFGDAWAHPGTLEQAVKAKWFPQRYRQRVRQHSAGRISRMRGVAEARANYRQIVCPIQLWEELICHINNEAEEAV